MNAVLYFTKYLSIRLTIQCCRNLFCCNHLFILKIKSSLSNIVIIYLVFYHQLWIKLKFDSFFMRGYLFNGFLIE